jgi:D-beta-D-heptose 7-phosphate kinase/D-beta-D-heptose 1-phosphate adenosyltransferase
MAVGSKTLSLLKIHTRESLVSQLNLIRARRRTGFTSGSFDLLHAGHVDYLAKARERCDLLIVGLNSDKSVKAYKDELRPIIPAEQRAKVLAALAAVDYVFIFDEENNNKNIEVLKPDVYFKAGDYSKDRLSSAPIVESYGGRVEIIPLVEESSTTAIIRRILTLYSTGSGGKSTTFSGSNNKADRKPT